LGEGFCHKLAVIEGGEGTKRNGVKKEKIRDFPDLFVNLFGKTGRTSLVVGGGKKRSLKIRCVPQKKAPFHRTHSESDERRKGPPGEKEKSRKTRR